MTLLSPLGAAVAELKAATAVSTITTRIRPIEPGPGDAQAEGTFLPFVVLSIVDGPVDAGTATSTVTLGMRCYAATYPAAEALYRACFGAFHRKGGRIDATSRLGIYSSTVADMGTPDKDPDTKQPLFYGIVHLNVSTQAIPI